MICKILEESEVRQSFIANGTNIFCLFILLESQLIDHEPQWESLIAEASEEEKLLNNNDESLSTSNNNDEPTANETDELDSKLVSNSLLDFAPLSSISEVTLNMLEDSPLLFQSYRQHDDDLMNV